MIWRGQDFTSYFHRRKMIEIGLSIIVGLIYAVFVALHPYLPLPSDWQKIVLVIPFVLSIVMLSGNLEKLILFTLAIGIPLNLDFSIIISPYGRNAINMANGRTIVALTSLRVSLLLIIVFVGYILWFIERRGARRTPVRFFANTSVPALGLIFISILSTFQAQDSQLAFFKIAQLFELFLIYFYLANHIRTKQDLQFFIVVFMVGMLAESLLMIVQWRTGLRFYIAGISGDVGASGLRPGGTLGSANTAGMIISANLAIACAMFLLFQRRLQKIFVGFCFMIGFVALIATEGRAAWGGFIVAVFGFIIIGWRRSWISGKILVWLLPITLIIGGIFYPIISSRLTGDDHNSAASRLFMLQLAWNVIQSSPSHFILGVGANNYALVAPAYNTILGGALGYSIQDASVHNVFLLTWAETGLTGLLFLIAFLLVPFTRVSKHIQSKQQFISLMALSLGCALIVVIIQMLVDPFIARPKIISLWLIVALITSLENMESL